LIWRVDSFSEKIFRFININSLNDKCKVCKKITKYILFSRGYRDYCSKKCRNSDIDIIERKNKSFKDNSILKWGVDNPMKNKENNR
jgi:endogenous inhibitor of DNA gyrase (YacG/DUF329 family)